MGCIEGQYAFGHPLKGAYEKAAFPPFCFLSVPERKASRGEYILQNHLPWRVASRKGWALLSGKFQRKPLCDESKSLLGQKGVLVLWLEPAGALPNAGFGFLEVRAEVTF